MNASIPQIEIGTGTSREASPFATGEAAARRAALSIRHHAVSVALVYASVHHDLNEVLAGVHAALGDVPVIGVTTAGELCDGMLRHSVVVVILASPHLRVQAAVGRHVSAGWREALDEALAAPALRAVVEAPVAAMQERMRHGTRQFAMIFAPGNTRHASSQSFEIVEAFKARSLGAIPVFAGGSADDWQLEGNAVLLGRQAFADGLLVAVFETELSFGIALGNGFRPSEIRATATAVEGHEILELNGVSAATLLPGKLGTDLAALAGRHITLATGHTFGSADPMGQYSVNVASYFTPRGGVRMTQPVPVGAELIVMEPVAEAMSSAGAETLRKAMLRTGTSQPAVVLSHYCALRPRIMGDESAAREIADMVTLANGAPLAGFCSFGEGGLSDDGVSRHNNASVAVLVLGRELSEPARVAQENDRLRKELLAQAELRLLGEALRQTEEAFMVADPRLCFRYVNPAFTRVFGYAPEEVIGKPVSLMAPAPGEYLVGMDEVARQALEHASFRGEVVRRARDGRLVPILLNVAPMRDASGQLTGYIGVLADISRHKTAEDALKMSEERFRTIANYTYDWEYWQGPERQLLYMSPSCERVTGHAVEAFMSDPGLLTRIVHPDDQAAMDAHLGHVSSQEVCELEFRIITRAGDIRWIAHGCRAVHGDDGRYLGRRASNRDITEKKQAELEYRTIVQTAQDGFLVVGPDRRFLETNDAYCQMIGYAREELLSLGIEDVEAEESPEEVARHSAEIRTHGHAQFETRHRRKDGGLIDVEVTANLLESRHGVLITFVRDITERKRVQTELDQHRHHLEERVAERTAQLEMARDQAEAANRAKSAFLANMSHELRTPMNAVLGFAQLLKKGATPAQTDRLVKITQAGEHLLSIINDVLDLSKIEADRLTLESVDFCPAEIFDEVHALLVESTLRKGLRLEIGTSALPPRLKGDPTRVRQALLNYAVNAVKFTDQGHIRLGAKVLESREGGFLLRFEVQDTGIGIAGETLSGLFQPFQQADNSFTRKYGGTGLGLALVRRLAQAMGGEAGVESEAGVGSTFWFTGWFEQGAVTPARASSGAGFTEPPEVILAREYAGRKVLLAEDDLVNQRVALELLDEAGLLADIAGDGEEALAMATATAYDLILMDMQMPRMDGLEATRRIRRIPGRQAVPILAMTANAFSGDRARCLEAGMNEHLTKPVTPDVLYKTLLQWLEQADAPAG